METRSVIALALLAISVLCSDAMSAVAGAAAAPDQPAVAKLKTLRPDLPIERATQRRFPG